MARMFELEDLCRVSKRMRRTKHKCPCLVVVITLLVDISFYHIISHDLSSYATDINLGSSPYPFLLMTQWPFNQAPSTGLMSCNSLAPVCITEWNTASSYTDFFLLSGSSCSKISLAWATSIFTSAFSRSLSSPRNSLSISAMCSTFSKISCIEPSRFGE